MGGQYYGINNGIMYDYDSRADIGMLSDEYSIYQQTKTYMTQLNDKYYYDNYDFEEDQEQEVDDFLF